MKLTKIIDKLSGGRKRRKKARILEKSMDRRNFTARYLPSSLTPGILLSASCVIISIICAFLEINATFYVILGITAASILVTMWESSYRVRVNTEELTESMLFFKRRITFDEVGKIEQESVDLGNGECSRTLIIEDKSGKKIFSIGDDAAGYEHIFYVVSRAIKTNLHKAKTK